jgi:hypothetical protein
VTDDDKEFHPPHIRDKEGIEIEFPDPAPEPPVEITHGGPEGDDPGEDG